jgi:gliding motility-associated-like protein
MVSNIWGCSDTVTKLITIEPDFFVFVPNAFTPNNDGINDVFYPQLTFVSDDTFSFVIMDRWGNQVIEIIDPTKGWEGKKDNGETYPPGVYAYTIRYTNVSGKPDFVSGKIVLMK